ncbi:MAG: hypothetical protein ISS16_02615 [Ignavibacteria bacterium]|nr:hypothetical protein [Ignavibacteria bacterium]
MSKSKTIFLVISLLIIIFSNYLYGQSQENSPKKVYRYCYVIKSKDWYKNQEKLWKIEISKNPNNEDAWYNYFFANRYASFGMDENERKKLLNSIVDDIGKAIPDSYLYPYLRYYNGERKIEHLEKAYQLKPDCADLYWDFIQYYELNGMKQQKKKYCEKLYLSKDIISSLYDYNFNMLNSTEKNSILFTNGDNDNYPAWVLQETKGVRQDVTVLNVHTVFVLRDYLKIKLKERELNIDVDILSKEDIATFLKELVSSIKNIYPETPIHIAPTVYYEYKKEVNDKLFTTGLGYTYSEELIDNLALIKKNLEQNLRLDHLEYNWYNEHHVSQSMMDRYNLNYIPAFMELAKAYNSSGEFESAKFWKDKSIFLAKKANDEDLIKKIEDENW